jgi:hypothetical protein
MIKACEIYQLDWIDGYEVKEENTCFAGAAVKSTTFRMTSRLLGAARWNLSREMNVRSLNVDAYVIY